MMLYDAFYRWSRDATSETHNWPTNKGSDVTEMLAVPSADGREQSAHGVSIGEAFRVWLGVAALSFGGPAEQIAVMHRILVEEKRWVSEGRFMHALNYCMLVPGPEAQQ